MMYGISTVTVPGNKNVKKMLRSVSMTERATTANDPKLQPRRAPDARTNTRLPVKSLQLQRLLPRGFGFRPSRFGQLSKALAHSGAHLSPRFGGGLRCICATLFRPSRPCGGGDFGSGCRAHFPAFLRCGIGLGRRAKYPGKFLFQGRDLNFDSSGPA